MAAGAVGGVAGGISSGLFAMGAAKRAYKRSRKFRQTAYQDTMSDMRAAGLNPILAYQKGATGGQAFAASQTPDFMGSVAKGVSSAVEARRIKQELKNMKAVELKDDALRDQADSQISLNEAAENTQRYIAVNTENSARLTHTNNQLLRTKLPAAWAEGTFDQTPGGVTLRRLNRVLRGFSGQSNILPRGK